MVWFMKSFSNFLSFFVPLVLMLIAFSIFLVSSNLLKEYKQSISNDYSIFLVANTPILKNNFESFSDIKVKKIDEIKRKKIISSMKESLSGDAITLLKQKLPYFYKLYLERFPTTNELISIKQEILKNKNIRKIEIFSKNHDQVYELFSLVQKITIILFVLLAIFAILLLSKQIRIWLYAHAEKISIMKLHGASTIYSASTLIKDALNAAFFSCIFACIALFLISQNISEILPYSLHGFTFHLSLKFDFLAIFALAFVISISSIFSVLFFYSISKDV